MRKFHFIHQPEDQSCYDHSCDEDRCYQEKNIQAAATTISMTLAGKSERRSTYNCRWRMRRAHMARSSECFKGREAWSRSIATYIRSYWRTKWFKRRGRWRSQNNPNCHWTWRESIFGVVVVTEEFSSSFTLLEHYPFHKRRFLRNRQNPIFSISAVLCLHPHCCTQPNKWHQLRTHVQWIRILPKPSRLDWPNTDTDSRQEKGRQQRRVWGIELTPCRSSNTSSQGNHNRSERFKPRSWS